MLNDADFYQESFLGSAASLFTDTYLIYWAYDANGNGIIDLGGCGDSPLPGEPCEEGVENANLISTIWGASTAILSAWFEQFGFEGIGIQDIIDHNPILILNLIIKLNLKLIINKQHYILDKISIILIAVLLQIFR